VTVRYSSPFEITTLQIEITVMMIRESNSRRTKSKMERSKGCQKFTATIKSPGMPTEELPSQTAICLDHKLGQADFFSHR
jgi:hypothetical protein